MDFAFSATGDVGTPETMAPVIVIPPGNRSVVAGSNEITLECIANARYAAGPPLGTRIHYTCDEKDLQWKTHHTCACSSSNGALV